MSGLPQTSVLSSHRTLSRRVPRRGLPQWLSETAQPLFMLDSRRVVIFFNSGCQQLTGWEAGDVIGRTCDFVSERDGDWTRVESLLATLAPPPGSGVPFAETPVTVPANFVDREGTTRPRLIHYLPIPVPEEPPRLLGIVLPIPAPVRFSPDDPVLQRHADLAAIKTSLRKRYDLAAWIAATAESRRVLSQLILARDSDCPVLLTGERGTGKEHAARTIHYQGPHRLKTFVPIDCETIPSRELGPVVRRFFTTEEGDPQIPIAQPGTLFLRNVDRLPRELQEFLAGQFATPRGDGRRIMASTRRPLSDWDVPPLPEFASLLTTLVIPVVPLRSRGDDLPLLAQALLEEANRGATRQVAGFSNDVLLEFRRYNWPGNVGELAEVVRGCLEMAQGSVITPADLPFRFRTGMDAQKVPPPEGSDIVPLERYLEEAEREQIRAALERAQGNKSTAAALLQIPRAKLYRRMEALGLATNDPNGSAPPGPAEGIVLTE